MQANLVGLHYLLGIFIGRTFYWLQFLFHLQRLASLGISVLVKTLEHIRQLTLFLFSLSQCFLDFFKFSEQSFSFYQQIRNFLL